MANDEWLDDVDPDLDDATLEALAKGWEEKTDAFLASDTDPLELHAFAQAWNWDNGTQRMRQVIEHPHCDAGTALMVYWRASPEFLSQFADREEARGNLEAFDLVIEIERRYQRGMYRTRSIPYDPATDGVFTGDASDPIKRPIPRIMYEPIVAP